MPFLATDFLEELSQSELLDAAQRADLATWQHYYPELPALMRELVNRGYLTEYQLEKLKTGTPARLVMGPYVLLDEIGQGGMGRVYKARHRHLERIVALKVINPSELDHPEAVGRFKREAKAIARLRHPNIVLLYDADEIDGLHFLALEYVQGIDLDKLLVQRGPFPLELACDCIRQAALGLQHAHERGLVHRDVKPANLLLTRDDGQPHKYGDDLTTGGVVKILDLGLARFSNIKAEIEKLSVDGIIVGTPDYLAPEQALDSSKVDIRADIYSLGCTFYELLTGQTPFAMVSGTQKLIAHIQQEPPPIPSIRAGLPLEMVQIVAKMMAKNPIERFQTPAEVAEVLADLGEAVNAIEHVGQAQPSRLSPPHGTRQPEVTGIIRFKAGRPVQAHLPGLYTEQPRELTEHSSPINCVAFSPDSKFALTAGDDKALSLWDMTVARKVRRLTGHTDAVLSVAFTPDGRQALSGGRDRSVLVWDVESGQQVARIKGLAGEVLSVAFSPDGRTFLTGGSDMTLSLWDRSTHRLIRQLGGLVRGRHFGPITSVLFTTDNARALSSSTDGTIRFWNVRTGSELHCFSGHKDGVRATALSPDGLHVASGGSDKAVRWWGVVSGSELKCAMGHTSPVLGVAFTTDGDHTLSVDERTLRVWEFATGHEVFRSRGDVQRIRCLAVSPDGRLVLTGGSDKFLCLWKRNE